MIVRYNKIFEGLTKGDLDKYRVSCEAVDFIIREGFVIIDGCYYFKSFAPRALVFSKDLIDRTGNECFFNKISLDTNFNSLESLDLLKCGISASFELYIKLVQTFKGERFNVIFSYNNDGASLRFHKDRNDENWLADDLDKYKKDAILQIKN